MSVSSPVATQLLHAVGHRPGGQDPEDRPGRDDDHGRGLVATRATSTRASTSRRSTSCRSSSSSRTTATRSACRLRSQVAGRRTSPTGPRATGSRASSSTASDVLACYAAARTAVARARAGDGPTLIEAKVTRLTAHSSRRPADEVPLRGGAGRREGAATRCRSSAAQLARRRRPDRRDRGARSTPRSRRPSTTRPTTPRRSRTRIPRPRCSWVYAEDWPSRGRRRRGAWARLRRRAGGAD